MSTRRGHGFAILSLVVATVTARTQAEDARFKVSFTDEKQTARTLEARLLVEAEIKISLEGRA